MLHRRMMSAEGKRRDWCCPGHSGRNMAHGTERAREKREWKRDQDACDRRAAEEPR